jgi:hypothetical protein
MRNILSAERAAEKERENMAAPPARAAEPVTVVGPLPMNEARDVHLGFWLPQERPICAID